MSTVLWEQDGPVGRITLNRPETINAWTAEFGKELVDTVDAAAADESVRAVLITGAGRGFSSGADLKAGFEPHPDDHMPDIRKELERYHGAIQIEELWRDLPADGAEMTRRVEAFRQLYNTIRPHETLAGARPIERYLADPDNTTIATASTRQTVRIP